MKVSFLMPVCNQGDEARKTLASARAAMGGLTPQFIVCDDHSLDGSCHGMGSDVLILRTHRRDGCTATRRLMGKRAEGDVLIWSDSHCRFPPGSFERMAKEAAETGAVVEPCVKMGHDQADAQIGHGGMYTTRLPGFALTAARRNVYKFEGVPFPALYGSIYAMSRETYLRMGEWPVLPGVWGAQETVLTLLLWTMGIEIRVLRDVLCIHKKYAGNRPFSVGRADCTVNCHWFHKAFFPRTYEPYWRPRLLLPDERGLLLNDEAVLKKVLKPLKSRAFRKFADFVAEHRRPDRTEEEAFRTLIRTKWPL